MGFGPPPAVPYILTKADIDAVLGYDVSAHEGRHADSGADEIDADDLVAGADPRSTTALAAALAHKARHASGGDDAIAADDLVAGADPRSSSHASRHASGQPDVVTPAAIAAVAKAGDESIAGVKTFTSTPVGPAADPTVDNQLARKAYIDAKTQGFRLDWSVTKPVGTPNVSFKFDQIMFGSSTNNEEARVESGWMYTWNYSAYHSMEFFAQRGTNPGITSFFAMTRASDLIGTPTAAHIGFRHFNNLLYATCANGSAQTVVSLGVALSVRTRLKWLLRAYAIDFYVNGILKTTITTNIPSAQSSLFFLFQSKMTVSGGREMYMTCPVYAGLDRRYYLFDVPADHDVSGKTVRGQAGETLALFEICYMKSDGKLWKAKADAAGTVPGLYMVTEALSADDYGTFLLEGYARDNTWGWTVGGILYAFDDTAGAMIQTAPSDSGDQVQRVGIAVTADIVYFKPDLTVIEMA